MKPNRHCRSLLALVAAACSLRASAAAEPEPAPILWSTAVSPDGSLVATSGLPTRWLYATDSLKPDPRADALPHTSANAIAFHPSKPILAIAGWPEVTGLYDYSSRTFTQLPTAEGVRSIAFNHDGSLVALAEHDGALTVWSVTTSPERIYRDRPDDAKSLTGVDWHPAQNTLITIGERVSIYDLTTEPPAEPRRFNHRPTTDAFALLLSVDWHPDADRFLLSDYGNTELGLPPVIQLRAADATLIKSIERAGAEIRNVRWSPDGSQFAATSDKLLIYNADAELISEHIMDNAHPANLWGLAWSPDAESIYITDQSARAWRWRHNSTKPVQFGAPASP